MRESLQRTQTYFQPETDKKARKEKLKRIADALEVKKFKKIKISLFQYFTLFAIFFVLNFIWRLSYLPTTFLHHLQHLNLPV